MRPVSGARFRTDHARLGSNPPGRKSPTRAVEELYEVAATRTERRLYDRVASRTLARLSGLIVVCFGRLWVLQTTPEVFTRISPDNSLECLAECSVGLVTDRSSDFYDLFVTLFK